MPDQGAQDKTEKATPKKRNEARKRGQVAKSREVTSVAVLLAGLSSLCVFGAYMYHHIKIVAGKSFSLIEYPVIDLTRILKLSEEMVLSYMVIVIPVMACVAVIAILANLMQVGFMLSWATLTPDFSKLNPLKGLTRLFSKQSMMEVFKSLFKLGLIGTVAYWTVKGEMENILALGDLEVPGIGIYILKIILKIFFRVSLAMIFLAIIDFAFQRWQFEEKLKMTKQEVKEEFKRTEGDPIVKGRIRKAQHEAARRRMMQEVPNADVVVTNPIHLAVAIKYDSLAMNAPKIVAKGAELIANRIKTIAKDHGVPIIENKLLARDLYKNVEVGDEVPSDFYQAVAEVLAYVYKLEGKAT